MSRFQIAREHTDMNIINKEYSGKPEVHVNVKELLRTTERPPPPSV